MREIVNRTLWMIPLAAVLGALLVAAGYGLAQIGNGAPQDEPHKQDAGTMRQYLVPADVTQEDAGTCWVEVRGNGSGHVACFAPGEESRFRPYALDDTADGNESYTVRP